MELLVFMKIVFSTDKILRAIIFWQKQNSFGFAVGICFCREIFGFYYEVFGFAVRSLVLP